jgi:7-keto-8-aminopelargonate synthetase-like enzyme
MSDTVCGPYKSYHVQIDVIPDAADLAALCVGVIEKGDRLLAEGIYAIGFFFPVVAKGQARIRTQMSAAHTREQLDRAIDAFIRIGRELGVLKG